MPRKKTSKKKEPETTRSEADIEKDLEVLNRSLEDIMAGYDNRTGKLKGKPEFDMTFLEVVTRLAAAGVKESDIGFFMGVQQQDIDRWKKNIPQFAEALKSGKHSAKAYLIAQGLRAAAGYEYTDVNVKMKTKVLDSGKVVSYPEEVSRFHKHQPPNPQLLMFMLCNLSRQLDDDEDKWTSAHKIEVDKNETVTFKITGEVASDQINRLAGQLLKERGLPDHQRKVIDCEVIERASDEEEDSS